jgi:UDP-2-acetamido-2,6-beta-L-arabino-hexul-4-ose reductase
MLNIGITGQGGFVGKHLYNTIRLFPNEFKIVEFDRKFFENTAKLNDFVSKCDVIVQLAALNRHSDSQVIYDTNIGLVQHLVRALTLTKSKCHVLFASSSQEENENLYGKSKKEGRALLIDWAKNSKGKFSGMIIPNVFGPFSRPNYNSVVATFCHKLTRNEVPTVEVDIKLRLIYIGELVNEIVKEIRQGKGNNKVLVPHTSESSVSELLCLLETYKLQYQDKGEIPKINNTFELNLFNTFRCYMDTKAHFPVKFTQHNDSRGSFVEVIRLGVGGQVSFSTTNPKITRGNHFHTRKIERFAVIKGKALIQLRRIGTKEVMDFYMDGNVPSYVDMPIWHTHNIKNIGDEVLYTNFWINEPYISSDADTYFEEV